MAMHSRLCKTPPASSNSSSRVVNPDPRSTSGPALRGQQMVSQTKTADASTDRQNVTKFTKRDAKKNPSRM